MAELNEISHSEALSKLLTDETLQDVTLEGTDGVRVGANRSILAARSEVFKRMLLGGFSEANLPVVKIGFKGNVLRCVVEYAVTNKADILDISASAAHEDGNANALLKEQVRTLVSLSKAASYFELPVFCQKVCICLGQILTVFPSLALELLEACHQEGGLLATREVMQLALPVVDASKLTNLKEINFAGLSPSALKEMLQDCHHPRDEYTLFEILRLWVLGTGNSADELVDCIHLEKIDPHLLSTKVAESRIISGEKLCEAFKLQALFAQDQGFLGHGHPFQQAVWESSSSKVLKSRESTCLSLVSCPPMSTGLYEWAIVIEKEPANGLIQVGIAAPNDSFSKTSTLGHQCYGWSYRNDGCTFHADKCTSSSRSKFAPGDIITFQLNLLSDANNEGTLWASGNGGKKFSNNKLFDSLKIFIPASKGFVPAASMSKGGRLRLLYIKQLQ